jgi:hypothetical protein
MPDTSAYAHAAQSVAGRESSVGPPLLRRQASAPSAGSGQAASQVVRALLSPAGLAPLPLDQWQAALPALAEQRLTPFVYAQLRRTEAWREIPPEAQRILAEDFQAHSLRTFDMEAELAAVAAALHASGTSVMLLKGAALGRTVYGSPAERPLGDMDLLIPAAAALPRASRALAQRGYEAQQLLLLPRWQGRYYAQRRLVRPASAGQRFVVELHWSLFELPYYVDLIPMAELWQAALAARYASFLSAGPASWQVTLGYGWDPEPGRGVYVEHGETWTRFGTEAYGGRLDLNRQHAVVAVASDERLRLALERTMVYLCLQALPLAGDRLLLLHAAGVARQGQGHVFLGPSGAGKATVARLASGYGQVLCDENVVARLGEAGPEALSTPFWGLSAPPELIERVRRRAPLRAIFSLQQAPDFSLTPLTPAHAVLAMVESNRIVAEHPARADVWLDAAQRLLAQVPVYRLSFRPTTELWAFLDGAT